MCKNEEEGQEERDEMDQIDSRNPTQQQKKEMKMLYITSGHFSKGLAGIICLNIIMSL